MSGVTLPPNAQLEASIPRAEWIISAFTLIHRTSVHPA